MNRNYDLPTPIIDGKEAEALDVLTKKYLQLMEPSKIAKIGTKASQLIPEKMKKMGKDIGLTISEQELYSQIMTLLGSGFHTLEEHAAKYVISEKQIIKKVNQNTDFEICQLNEICFLRSYDVAKSVNAYKNQDILAATLEGGGTGALGFAGLPLNIALSTFLYFRAVQSIAMFYGYDVKNDSAEMVIASEVFTNALSPKTSDANNEMTNIIAKIMLMSQATAIKQTAKKTWTHMIEKGGIPLLLAQMRALANKSAQKALQNAGQKGLENSVFKETFEQIGRKLTLKNIGKAVPIASAVVGALMDTAQMKQVLTFADLFYQKRFILEKESRIANLMDNKKLFSDDVIDIEFTEK